MMYKKLFLDDFRIPSDCFSYKHDIIYNDLDWDIVRDYDEFTRYVSNFYNVNNRLPDLISFDHDLSEEHYAPKEYWNERYSEWEETNNFIEKTGKDCANWLVNFCMDNNVKLCEYLIHSMNPAGGENIKLLLDNYKKHETNNI